MLTGQIHNALKTIIEKVSSGNEIIATTTKTKLVLKGIDPDKYDPNSEDDPQVMEKVKQVANEFNVQI
ncbi:MAG: hypothetical protein ACQESF_06255 [Nanobdellota archaeon]